MRSVLQAWRELDVPRHKAEFYRMWQTGYSAGLPHATVLSAAGEFHRSPTVRALRQALLDGLRQRRTITDILRDCRTLLEPFEFALLEMGEESGRLEEALGIIADHFTAEYRAMLTVKKRLAYPMATGIAGIFIAPFPILFFGNALLYLAIVLTETLVALAAGGAILTAVAGHYRHETRVVLARFCRTLALTIESGLGLDRAAELAVLAADHPELTAYWRRVPRDRRRGQSLATVFSECRVLPRSLTAALEVADVSGDYGGTVRKLADLYDAGVPP